MQKLSFLILCLLTAALEGRAGKLITYKDENGSLYAVESMADIPEKYRSQVKTLSNPSFEETNNIDPCVGKKHCGTIYVTPWSVECRQSDNLFRRMLRGKDATYVAGLRIVVGQERASGDNGRLAQYFGPGAVTDPSSEWHKKFSVTSYPSFFVQDEKGEIIQRGDAARAWVFSYFHP